MKKRGDDIQTTSFHNAARISGGGTRILTPPQHNNSPNTTQNQYQILNVLRDQTGSTQSIQYTYTPVQTTNIQKNNNVTQQQSLAQTPNPSVHVVNATTNVTLTNVRAKPATSGSITPTPVTIQTSPSGNSIPVPNVTGQNFPRLKVEDALSYLDQV